MPSNLRFFTMCRRIFNNFAFSKIVSLVWLCAVILWGSSLQAKSAQASVTTTITSQTMTANNQERRAVFRGSVVLTQADLVVHSDEMIVVFKQEDDSEQAKQDAEGSRHARKIERIEARGNVVIQKAAGKAKCRKAIYFKDEEKIVLMGSPVAWQDGTRVSGQTMIMYLKENRSVVEGGSHVVFVEEEGG